MLNPQQRNLFGCNHYTHDEALRATQGFWGFREGYLFSGIWGKGSFIFRDLGRKHNFLGFREQGAEEKHFRELGRKVIFLSGSREQRPPWGGGGYCQFGVSPVNHSDGGPH